MLFLKTETDGLLEADLIEDWISPWAQPCVIAKRNMDGKITRRLCIDYRKVNDVIQGDGFPMQSVDNMLRLLPYKKYYSKIDLKSGYWQFLMGPVAQELSTFITPFG